MIYIIYAFSLLQLVFSIYAIFKYKKNILNNKSSTVSCITLINDNKNLGLFFISLPILIFVSGVTTNNSLEGFFLAITTALFGFLLIYINRKIYIYEDLIAFGNKKLYFKFIEKLEISTINNALTLIISINSNKSSILFKISNDHKDKIIPFFLSKLSNKVIIKDV